MSTIENKKFISTMFDDLRQKGIIGEKLTLEWIQSYVADETLIHHILASQEGFPFYWIEVEEMLAEADLVSIRGWFCGIQQGDFMGIAPTGKEVKVPIFATYRIAGEKIVDHWMMLDRDVFMKQLGVIQPEGNP